MVMKYLYFTHDVILCVLEEHPQHESTVVAYIPPVVPFTNIDLR